jgi:hypothetical protein
VGAPAWHGIGEAIRALASSYFENMRRPGAASIVGAAAVLGGAAILASLMPAARTSRVDVLNALRSE